jgi:hypothetical protein
LGLSLGLYFLSPLGIEMSLGKIQTIWVWVWERQNPSPPHPIAMPSCSCFCLSGRFRESISVIHSIFLLTQSNFLHYHILHIIFIPFYLFIYFFLTSQIFIPSLSTMNMSPALLSTTVQGLKYIEILLF